MRKLKTLNIRTVKHLCKHLQCSERELERFCNHPKHFYIEFNKVIKNKERPIAQPIGRLDEILYKIQYLLNRVELPSFMHGGIKGCSPKTNAKVHIGKTAVLNFDLESFFPSVKPHMVYNLLNKDLGCSPDVSRTLTRLVTLNGELPQGSPTSTVVANLVITPLAERLKGLSDKHNCDYSQFVDDGTISGPGYIENLRSLIEKIIKQEGLQASPKPHKRKTSYRQEEQIVTGIKVNVKMDAPNQKIRDINNNLDDFRNKVILGRKYAKKEVSSLKGKIQYLISLNKKKGNILKKKLESILKKAS